MAEQRSRSGFLGSHRLVVGVAAVAVIGGAFWWLRNHAELRETPPTEAALAPLLAAAPTSGPAAVVAQEERAPVPAGQEGYRSGAVWVEGRVVLPRQTPADEVARILASAGTAPGGESYSTSVENDGSFRVAFPLGSRTGSLQLEARYLHSPSREIVLEAAGDIVIEPEMGGLILGRLVPPAGAEDVAATLSRLTVSLSDFEWPHDSSRPTSPVAADGRFELRAVPAGKDWSLECEQMPWTFPHEVFVQVAAGETQEVELPLIHGVRLTGRVIDEGGEVHGATFGTGTKQSMGILCEEELPMNEDGTFDVRGLAPGSYGIFATMIGRTSAFQDLGLLDDGRHVEGLELRLTMGQTLAGRLVWASEDRPAPGVKVHLGYGTAVTASDGSFRFTGLDAGPVTLWAQARPPPELDLGAADHHVLQERVLVGQEDVLLRLGPGLPLRGRVQDRSGRPVAGCKLVAGTIIEFLQVTVAQTTSHGDGSFLLEGVWPRALELSAFSRGHSDLREILVDPREDREITIELDATASISGQVVDPSGRPVPLAYVGHRGAPGQGGGYLRRADLRRRCDDAGRFQLEHASPGQVWLGASSPGFADSATSGFSLGAGERLEGVILRLRELTRLTGELSPELAPVAGQDIFLSSDEHNEIVKTDSNGRFEVQGLPPGEYEVELTPFERGLRRTEPAGVVIEEGGSSHVVLVRAKEVPILVVGTIRGPRGPATGVEVRARGSHNSTSSQAEGKTGTSGDYTLIVERAGRFEFMLVPPGGRMLTQWVEIPAGERHRQDFMLPGGALRGRVLDTEGVPTSAVEVHLEVQDQHGRRHAAGLFGLRPDPDGSFAIEHLTDGTYCLRVDREESYGSDGLEGALVRRDGFRIARGSAIEGIELRLPHLGAISGTVRGPDGGLAAGVTIYARPQKGTHPVERTKTDPLGRFQVSALPPGAWLLFASDGRRLVSEESLPLHIDGNKRVLDLALRNGTVLKIRIEDPEGKPLETGANVIDTRGLEHAYRRIDSSGSERQHRLVGPLAPGVYQISREGEDGTSASLEITLAGEPEREVTLRLRKP